MWVKHSFLWDILLFRQWYCEQGIIYGLSYGILYDLYKCVTQGIINQFFSPSITCSI